jgi:hypothetical protein
MSSSWSSPNSDKDADDEDEYDDDRCDVAAPLLLLHHPLHMCHLLLPLS